MKHTNATGCTELGPRLRFFRRRAKQTLQDVADGIGSSKSQIWEIEKGVNLNPTIGTVMALAAHFNVRIGTLVEGSRHDR